MNKKIKKEHNFLKIYFIKNPNLIIISYLKRQYAYESD